MNQQSENNVVVDWDSLIATAQRAARLTSVDPEPQFTREGDVETSNEVAVERTSSGLFLKKRWVECETTSRFGKGDVQVLGPHWRLARKWAPSVHYPEDRWEHITEVLHESYYYALLPDGEIVEVYLTEDEITPKPRSGAHYKVIHDHKCQPPNQWRIEHDHGLRAEVEQSLQRLLSHTAGNRKAPVALSESTPRSRPVEPPNAKSLVQVLRSATAFLLTFVVFTLATYVTTFLNNVRLLDQETGNMTHYRILQYVATSEVGASMVTGLVFAAIVGVFGSFFCTLPWVSVLYAVLAVLPITLELPYLLPAAGVGLQDSLYVLLVQMHPALAVLLSILAIPVTLALAGLAQAAIPYWHVKRVVRQH